MTEAWRLLLERAWTLGNGKTFSLYIEWDEAKTRLFSLSKPWWGFSSLKHPTPLWSLGWPLTKHHREDEHAYRLLNPIDSAMHFATYYMLSRLEFLILNYDLSMKSNFRSSSRGTSLKKCICLVFRCSSQASKECIENCSCETTLEIFYQVGWGQ